MPTGVHDSPRSRGRPVGSKNKVRKVAAKKEVVKATPDEVLIAKLVPEERKRADEYELSPLDYMLMVINDKTADRERRDRMSIYAAPYMHTRVDTAAPGKKDAKQKAANDASAKGKFTPALAPPRLVVDAA